jgi:hypothetical protein
MLLAEEQSLEAAGAANTAITQSADAANTAITQSANAANTAITRSADAANAALTNSPDAQLAKDIVDVLITTGSVMFVLIAILGRTFTFLQRTHGCMFKTCILTRTA